MHKHSNPKLKICFLENFISQKQTASAFLMSNHKVISSTSDKVKISSMNFASNSILDPKILPYLTSLMKHKLCNTSLAKHIKNLDSRKVTGPDKIPVFALKNLSSEISPILAKLFNHSFKEKCFPGLWKEPAVYPVYNTTCECSCHNIIASENFLRLSSTRINSTETTSWMTNSMDF